MNGGETMKIASRRHVFHSENSKENVKAFWMIETSWSASASMLIVSALPSAGTNSNVGLLSDGKVS